MKSEDKDKVTETFLELNEMEKYLECSGEDNIYHHKICLIKFYANGKSVSVKQVSNGSSKRAEPDVAALEKIYSLVEQLVIVENEIYCTGTAYQSYISTYAELNVESSGYSKQYLIKLVKSKLKDVKVIVYKNRSYMCRNDMDYDEAVKKINDIDERNPAIKLKNIAMELRHIIKSMDINKLPKTQLTEEHIKKGECSIPQELSLFMQYLLYGTKQSCSDSEKNRITTICHSIIFCMSSGHIKPSTQLQLAMVMKSSTNCKRLLEVLNKLGFSCSYNIAEELETELAYTLASNNSVVPYGIIGNNSGLCTSAAFDNYDRFIDTATGKNTLHDTVGIIYQNKITTLTKDTTQIDTPSEQLTNIRRRRKYYSPFNDNIRPYTRTFKKLPTIEEEKDELLPENLYKSIEMDNLWMMYHAFEITGKIIFNTT